MYCNRCEKYSGKKVYCSEECRKKVFGAIVSNAIKSDKTMEGSLGHNGEGHTLQRAR